MSEKCELSLKVGEYLTGGIPIKVRESGDGALVVIAHDGKKHFFTEDDVNTAIEALRNPPKAAPKRTRQAIEDSWSKAEPLLRGRSEATGNRPVRRRSPKPKNPLVGDQKSPPEPNPLGPEKGTK